MTRTALLAAAFAAALTAGTALADEAKPAEAPVAEAAKPAVVAKPSDKVKAAEAAQVTEAAKPAAPPAPIAPPEAADRVIEKRDSDYLFKLTLKPGNLQANRVADASIEVVRILEIPDPTFGERMPIASDRPIATLQAPLAPGLESAKGKKAAPPPPGPVSFVLWPQANPGSFGFHFTPGYDGVYTLTFEGQDTRGNPDEPRRFTTSFRIGVGADAAQTEQSQGAAAARKGSRRPVGSTGEKATEEKLQRLMDEVGRRFLDLEALLAKPPAKGPHAEAAVAARALGQLIVSAKGMTPGAYQSAAGEYEKLLAAAPAALEAVALAAEGVKDRQAPRLALAHVERQSCLQCHAKFRYAVTTDLSTWPKFEQRPWKK